MQRDIHYRMAKSEGYRARSAYKLLEILDHFHLPSNISSAVDLCAAPGSWSQVISSRIKGKILSIDIQDIEPIPGVETLKGDITSLSTMQEIQKRFPNGVDLLLCDGAPEVTGLHDLDEYFQLSLISASSSLAQNILSPSGCFITKIFTSDTTNPLVNDLRRYFEKIEIVKPKSSRPKSKEAFAICTSPIQSIAHTYA
ncbi:tRNA (cytidine32/guanosine34-2'-O)-methyltransferase [Nematocida sp. LUAm3]|nr:tRNA (cytidine32/guanosine34-2'-O)-methyltransferase [Nematocida sp. LUAm3]KAI5175534.1 tRNA (cytidine32/guanosine34-2'-O)-methyltransferase [Nematocida sp. LUAm2]KAI5178436.1 tRNA (cytidine32/guanosine34-2'-O)-methyltransferase [Nematocida sp. LUAm1]